MFMFAFAVQKLLRFIKSHFFIVVIFINLGNGLERIFLWFMSKSVLPVFSSKTFIVSGLTLKFFKRWRFENNRREDRERAGCYYKVLMVIWEVMYYLKADHGDCGKLKMCSVNSKSDTYTFKKRIIKLKRKKTDETKKQLLNHKDNYVTFHFNGFSPRVRGQRTQIG